ncbi:EpsG family protein [Lactobacillus helveticus]|uniref:EpsG family protein n=2 Tax=Lactobacillus helveticus TaxID=1587 RepID=UPI001562CD0D|nr:EpsG family protein [Lactobacillus helveticus]NRO07956.1 hypothetical protein [Lactobacillus helveticus]
MTKAVFFILIIGIGYFVSSKWFYSLIVMASIAILSYMSPNIADFAAYQGVYNFIGANGNEYFNTGYGWWILCKLGNQLHLNYITFKTILLIVGFVLILYFLKIMKVDNNVILASYLVYPAITDIIQIRFFLATSIVLFLITFLIKENVKSYLIYIFGIILIAAQIHPSAYFYLLLVLWKLLFKFKIPSTIFTFILLLIVIIEKRFLMPIISYFGTDQESNYYLSGEFYASNKLMILFFLTTVVFFILSFYMYKNINKDELVTTQINYLKLVIFSNYISIFLVILSTFAFTFLRMQKPIWLLNYATCALYAKYGTKGKLSSGVIWIIYIFIAIIWLFGTEKIALNDFFK